MYNITEIIKNLNNLYENNDALAILKDFERVFDDLDIYVFENWEDGELIEGPLVERHWVTCSFMWPYKKMPNPEAAKRLSEYQCQISYKKDKLLVPRKIHGPEDFRPGTKKGKLDEFKIWIVEIQMPKKLILDVFRGYHNRLVDQVASTIKSSSAEQLVTPQPETMAAEPSMTSGTPPVAAAPTM